jgi:hypothetical protein
MADTFQTTSLSTLDGEKIRVSISTESVISTLSQSVSIILRQMWCYILSSMRANLYPLSLIKKIISPFIHNITHRLLMYSHA